MTTKVWTFYICDRCGKKVEYEGERAVEVLPEGWSIFTYNLKEGEDKQIDCCPDCDKAIAAVLQGSDTPEKKPRKRRSDANIPRVKLEQKLGQKTILVEKINLEPMGTPTTTKVDYVSAFPGTDTPKAAIKVERLITKTGLRNTPYEYRYGNVIVHGETARATLQALDLAIGTTTWRLKLCPEDVELVKAIEGN